MTVLTDDLLASFDESVGPVDEARLLPPVLYTSPEFYEFERRGRVPARVALCRSGRPGPRSRGTSAASPWRGSR